MKIKNIVSSWITTLVGVSLFVIITYNVAIGFSVLTMPQVLIILAMYLIAGGLMFVSDKFFKDTFKRLSNKL